MLKEALIVIFILLIGIPVARNVRRVPNRIHDLRLGVKGFLFVPLTFGTLIITAVIGRRMAEVVPVLQWGWLGYNIVAAPLVGGTGSSGGVTGVSVFPYSALNGIVTVLFIAIIVIALLIFNYDEELIYRDSYRSVAKWAALHLLMGIPIWAVIPIFSTGLVYKYIYDRYSEKEYISSWSYVINKEPGVRHAYAAHFGTNAIIVSLLATAIFVL